MASVFLLTSFSILIIDTENCDADPIKCDKCGKTFKDWDSYLNHYNGHLEDAKSKTDNAINGAFVFVIIMGIVVTAVCIGVVYSKKNRKW